MDLFAALVLAALTAAAAEVGRQAMRKAIRRFFRRSLPPPPRTFADELFEELDGLIREARREKGDCE